MKIGITNNQYPEQRNILVNPDNEYINLKKSNLFYFINPLRTRLLKKNKTFVFQPVPFSGASRADILHLFNEVAITQQKWVASFETELSRAAGGGCCQAGQSRAKAAYSLSVKR